MYDIRWMFAHRNVYLIDICFLLHKSMCDSMLLTPLSHSLMYLAYKAEMLTGSHGFIGATSHKY